jgi:PAS domain S-box-containing protein
VGKIIEVPDMVTPLFTENSTPMWIVDKDSLNILEVNSAAVESYGYDRKEFLSKAIGDLQPKAKIVANIIEDKTSLTKQFERIGTINHKDKWGNTYPVELFSCPMEYEGNKARLIKATPLETDLNNIHLIDKTEQELNYHLANSPLAYVIWDDKFQLKRFSPKITQWLGFVEDDLRGETSTKLAFKHVIDCDFSKVKEKIDALLSGAEKSNEMQFGVTTKEGKTKYLHYYNSALCNEDGELVSVLSLVENETPYIENEKIKLRQRELIQNTSDFVGLVDADGNIVYMNPSGRKMLSLTEDRDIIGTDLTKYHPEITNEFLQDEVFPIAAQEGVWRGELTFQNSEGKNIPTSTVMTAHKDAAGNVEYFSTISRDISQEKQIQNELKQERDLQRLLSDIRYNIDYFEEIEEALEESLKNICEFINWPFAHIYVFNNEKEQLETAGVWYSDGPEANSFIEETLATTFQPDKGLVGKVYVENIPYWLKAVYRFPNYKRKGTIAGLYKSCISIPVKGDPSAVIELYHEDSVERDQQTLTHLSIVAKQLGYLLERRKSRQEIAERERKFRYLAENATDKVAIFDEEANCIYASPSTEALLGYTPEEYMEKDIIGLVHPDDRSAIRKNLSDLIEGNGKKRITYRLQHKDGHYIWMENSMKPIYDDNENLLEIRSAARDVSDRISYEQQLEKEKEFTEKALNSLPGLFYVLDKDGNYVRLNEGFEEELGYTKEEVKQMSPLDFYYEEDHQRISEAIEQAFTEGAATTVAKIKTKDGSDGWYHLTGAHFQQNGKDYILGSGINISKRILAEQQLEQQTALLSNLFKNAPVGIVMLDDKDDILEVNDSFETMFGYASDQVIGKNIDDLITPDKYRVEQKEVFREQRKGQDSFQYESVRINNDGTEVPVLIGLVPIVVSDNSTISYIIYVDITERKSYLNKIKQSLKEKRILLQEIHHRVKNNLAVVSSFLQLQKFNTEDEELQKILSDSEMRIHTMALIHEQLYQTESLSEISVENYVRELIGSIKDIHDPEDRIAINIRCDDIGLNINQAVPCAMIVNELISNSFEHAFEDSGQGEIKISITDDNGTIDMQVHDNGCGLPSGFNPDSTLTLGFTLINTLVQQLEAEIDIESNEGTSIAITFDKANVKGSSSALV